ncbi:pknH-like extracellular domain protein [Mycolicibacterium hassiacum DSM 44199]|uniref:PknH-like extracellular domain protein n=1 Tax=Mycolicibacterium hassiacum (strain DSM 44199 / CIP 105218 / JCM 12690 / 3849) TaxID=1122247 RepID=K5B9Q6_MYCHD|nr:sensor domain-containing protein [Mycolicibacterium hassiacum]EKF25863.1 pknH-like extracellular domain protein [Mycolicibacterium hassiacum DSM 44199]MDA4088343.1 hypothetical protein [Mycolicibacterium hassiacum DSM 44199]VCT92430.1 Serine/threonine-protein kinase PknH [Mycolicibacterium hassiacum DSM 44199]
MTGRPGRAVWAWSAAAAALLVVVGAVVVVARSGGSESAATHPKAVRPADKDATGTRTTSRQAPTETTVSPKELPALLLSAADISALLDAGPMKVTHDNPALLANTSDPADCGAVTIPAIAAGYQGSGYLGIQVQNLLDASADGSNYFEHQAQQAVAAFPSARRAREFVSTESARWIACTDRRVTVTAPNTNYIDSSWQVLHPAFDHEVLTATLLNRTTSGWDCQRVMMPRRNVVVDVRVCGWSGGGQARALATRITDRVPA